MVSEMRSYHCYVTNIRHLNDRILHENYIYSSKLSQTRYTAITNKNIMKQVINVEMAC
jgi:hypothetical protein